MGTRPALSGLMLLGLVACASGTSGEDTGFHVVSSLPEDGADDGTAMAMAMEQALAMMTAPKRVVRDPVTGQVMGVETITDG